MTAPSAGTASMSEVDKKRAGSTGSERYHWSRTGVYESLRPIVGPAQLSQAHELVLGDDEPVLAVLVAVPIRAEDTVQHDAARDALALHESLDADLLVSQCTRNPLLERGNRT